MSLKQVVTAALGLALAAGAAQAESTEALKRELAAKKAQVAKLQKRVRELENKSPEQLRGTIAPTPVQANQSAPQPLVAQGSSLPPSPPAAPAPPAPDEDEMDRALERTLVREGSLVLPAYSYEVTPQLSYAHWDKVQDPFVRNSYGAALAFRVGLPWETQLSLSLPYIYNELQHGSSSGLGDAGFVLSKGLLHETETLPNLVANIGWTSPTSHGSAFSPIPYVSGFQGGMTASKRLDPLVVFGNLSYFSSASREVAGTKSDASDVVALRVGSSLAISPATSVTAGLNLAYLTDPRVGDLVLANSDRLLSTVDVGLSTIVWHRTLLNLTAQFGLTGHVPDIRIITSLPIRF